MSHIARRRLEAILGARAFEGNRVEVLRNGDEIFPSMLAAIRGARHTVDFLTFVYWTGNVSRLFADALSERAESGVRVRVLLDALGARSMRRELIHQMEEAGVDVEWFREPRTLQLGELDHRTHRKILVVDEEIGFTGGVGIAEEWEGDARDHTEWRDTHFRLTGPAVDGLRSAFVANWLETGKPLYDRHDRFPDLEPAGDVRVIVVRGAAQVGYTDIALMVRTVVREADRRIRLTTSYFNPDDAICGLLCQAARRGVQVDVLLPGPHMDKRVCSVAAEKDFEPLLEAGVRIWRYQPTMMHAKILTIDETFACVGSANLNQRSLLLDEEVCLVVFDEEVTGILDNHFLDDLERAEPVDPGRWKRRGITRRAMERVVGLVEREM